MLNLMLMECQHNKKVKAIEKYMLRDLPKTVIQQLYNDNVHH
jgi:hypothetical protein